MHLPNYFFFQFIYLKTLVDSEQSQNVNLIDTLNRKIHELRLRQMKEIIAPSIVIVDFCAM